MLATPSMVLQDTRTDGPCAIGAQYPSHTKRRASELTEKVAIGILAEVMPYRRAIAPHACIATNCPSCLAPHLPKIIAAIERAQPIAFVLPAFPGKSPNLSKVLGPLPDMAERRSLEFLARLCERIQMLYAPGAQIILCSDGRVFSDVVGMREGDVTDYQEALSKIIEDLSPARVSTFNLEDAFGEGDFGPMRESLMGRFGSPLEVLKDKVRKGTYPPANSDEPEATRMYRGITRFLFEDSIYQGQTKSRTALQKEARAKAYEVIRRSNAWSEFIATRFPEAIRLSIHPQVCGSKKLGIRLIGDETWMTPWHGVAVETDHGTILLKRAEAEALGAQLVHSLDGQPSHFTLSGVLNPNTRIVEA